MFDAIHHLIASHPHQLALVMHPAQLRKNFENGKLSVVIGVENGYPLGLDIGRVKQFYDLGARFITLSHSRNNQLCDASTDKPSGRGLTPLGEEVVKEMNRLGMLMFRIFPMTPFIMC